MTCRLYLLAEMGRKKDDEQLQPIQVKVKLTVIKLQDTLEWRGAI